jgi:hypothetical protein
VESLRAAVVHVNRKRDGDRALREHEPITIVAIDLQIIGDDLELVASHLEYFVVVNAHKKSRESRMPGRKIQVLFAPEQSSRQIESQAGTALIPAPKRSGAQEKVAVRPFALCRFATKFVGRLGLRAKALRRRSEVRLYPGEE